MAILEFCIYSFRDSVQVRFCTLNSNLWIEKGKVHIMVPTPSFFEGSARLSLNGLLRLVGEILIFVIRPYPRKEEPKALF